MTKRSLGRIPLISRVIAKFKLKSLESKAENLKDKVCDLSKDVQNQKDAAAKVFYKADWDKIVNRLDTAFEQACECGKGAAGDPSGIGAGIAKLKKECTEEVAKKHGIAKNKKGDYTGKKVPKSEVDRCIEEKGG